MESCRPFLQRMITSKFLYPGPSLPPSIIWKGFSRVVALFWAPELHDQVCKIITVLCLSSFYFRIFISFIFLAYSSVFTNYIIRFNFNINLLNEFTIPINKNWTDCIVACALHIFHQQYSMRNENSKTKFVKKYLRNVLIFTFINYTIYLAKIGIR